MKPLCELRVAREGVAAENPHLLQNERESGSVEILKGSRCTVTILFGAALSPPQVSSRF